MIFFQDSRGPRSGTYLTLAPSGMSRFWERSALNSSRSNFVKPHFFDTTIYMYTRHDHYYFTSSRSLIIGQIVPLGNILWWKVIPFACQETWTWHVSEPQWLAPCADLWHALTQWPDQCSHVSPDRKACQTLCAFPSAIYETTIAYCKPNTSIVTIIIRLLRCQYNHNIILRLTHWIIIFPQVEIEIVA